MIYSYAIGYHNVCWTMSFDSIDCLLMLSDTNHANDRSNLGLRRRPISLLQTCKSISQEAHLILFNQTRFDIHSQAYDPVDHSRYHLRVMLPWNIGVVPSHAQVVLRRVKHIRILYDNSGGSFIFWKHYLLSSRYLDSGRQLRSLRFAFSGRGFVKWLKGVSNREGFPFCRWYKGNATLDFCDSDFTDEDIAYIKECFEGNCYGYYFLHIHADLLQCPNNNFPSAQSRRAMIQVTRKTGGLNLLINLVIDGWP